VVANQCDGVIIVVRAYQEERGLVSRMLRELGESNSEIIGILLNRPRTAAGGYLKKNYAAIAGYSGRGKKEE
jgi:Mrp family chromosome partitioning ATPase